MDKRRLIQMDKIPFMKLPIAPVLVGENVHYEDGILKEWLNDVDIITEHEIVKPVIDEFRQKLSKWMFHNSESVCGNNMIDIDYLEGEMDELLYELGVYGEQGNE